MHERDRRHSSASDQRPSRYRRQRQLHLSSQSRPRHPSRCPCLSLQCAQIRRHLLLCLCWPCDHPRSPFRRLHRVQGKRGMRNVAERESPSSSSPRGSFLSRDDSIPLHRCVFGSRTRASEVYSAHDLVARQVVVERKTDALASAHMNLPRPRALLAFCDWTRCFPMLFASVPWSSSWEPARETCDDVESV